MSNSLSPTMQRALAYARLHGGSLRRYPGGYWSKPDGFDLGEDKHFNANTIQGLVERGVARYSEQKTSQFGQFNTVIEIIDEAATQDEIWQLKLK